MKLAFGQNLRNWTNINTATVATIITAGIDYSSLEEMCTSMNISRMFEKTYIKYRENIIDDYKKLLCKI